MSVSVQLLESEVLRIILEPSLSGLNDRPTQNLQELIPGIVLAPSRLVVSTGRASIALWFLFSALVTEPCKIQGFYCHALD